MLRRSSVRALLAALAAAALALSVTTPVLAQAPSNDDFDNATTIPGLPFSDSLNTAEATTAADDPDCVGNGHTVWYSFTPAADVEVSASTFGSDYDTTLSAYTGARGTLTQIACNDDSGGLQSRILFQANAGETYHLMVGSFFDSPGGNLVLSVDEAPPPLSLALTIDPTGSVSRAGVATIHGTVTCSREAPGVFILGTIRQQAGKKAAAVATYSATVDCTGTSAWSASAAGETARFKRGDAQVIASVSYFDQGRGEIVRARASRTVRLQ